MKKHLFFFLFLFLLAAPVFSQKRKTPVKIAPKKPVAPQTIAPLTEIPAKDWDAITDALNKEDWMQAATLTSLALDKLKDDNEKRQLAQLRYLYVYATAGKVSEGKISFDEFEKIVGGFVGKEFVMPGRTILANCSEKVNYICPTNENDQIFRVTTADKVATIHSFEYVKLAEYFNVRGNDGKTVALGGLLEKTEVYLGKSNLKIIRLIFDGGSVTIIPG